MLMDDHPSVVAALARLEKERQAKKEKEENQEKPAKNPTWIALHMSLAEKRHCGICWLSIFLCVFLVCWGSGTFLEHFISGSTKVVSSGL